MGSRLIDGVFLTPLKRIDHPDGDVFHGIKKSDNGYVNFGEAYFSTIKYNSIKPWKQHLKMTLNLIVPVGEIKFVLYDNRENSVTKGTFNEIILSPNNYFRLTVPPEVFVAFKGIGEDLNLLLNVADMEHDPNEIKRISLSDINYNWE